MRARKIAMLGALTLVLAACGTDSTGPGSDTGTALDLSPVPYEMTVPADLLDRLATSPFDDAAFLEEATAAGATATIEVTYDPVDGDPIHFMNVYLFPEEAFDAAQMPDAPPPYGEEIRRENGNVLAVWGPLDMPFEEGSEDADAWSTLTDLIREPATFVPTS